jgi:hypothetical protein
MARKVRVDYPAAVYHAGTVKMDSGAIADRSPGCVQHLLYRPAEGGKKIKCKYQKLTPFHSDGFLESR